MIIACNHIEKRFNDKIILSDVHFHINPQDKIGLIGHNGAGKTTLFKMITKEILPDNGEITYSKNCSIGYLEQHMTLQGNSTVYDELIKVFDEVIKLESKLEDMANEIAKTHSLELTNQYDALRQTFEEKKGYEYKSLVKGVLKGLGFLSEVYDRQINELSGGQKTRVALAKLLLEEPSILLLDEPTNHLDIASIEWLENFLRSYRGAVLVISHDRYFLDKIVNKVVHLEFGKSNVYYGNYDHFIIESAKAHEVAMHQYEKQQQEIARQKAVIAKLRQFNREKSIKRAESREKMLAKQEVMEMPMIDNKPMNLILAPQIQSGNDVVSVNNLKKCFNDKVIFDNICFDIKRGDKVAIVGANGVGKTTIFKMMLEQFAPDGGEIKIGTNVHIGYYDQAHDTLNTKNTIIEELQENFPSLTNGHIRNVLAAFLFIGEDVFKPISSLSGGERGRVVLSKIMLSFANLLLLDEPTNHLDIMSKEVLERAISTYEGTVLYISHDRYFINQTATKILEMQPNKMTLFLGDYDYYIEKKKEQDSNFEPSLQVTEVKAQASKADWQKSKELQTQIRRLKTQIEKTEQNISDIEAQIEDIDNQLCQEEVYSDFERSKQLTDDKENFENEMAALYEKWEELSCELETFE
ncbi:MAG: ABC transporter [Epulopiscium sp. Nele67-Bin005]|nr:MAG: ABC transporter [Epulopiscium sp. Nele67-Bin005]